MSRYVMMDNDLVITVGMDFTCQFWSIDHRGEPLPFTIPCKLTVTDKLGQIMFETESENVDPLTDPVLVAAPENGVLQLTIPRGMTVDWFPGINYYDLWGTIVDDEASDKFPNGQQLPVAKGRFIVMPRRTELEGH